MSIKNENEFKSKLEEVLPAEELAFPSSPGFGLVDFQLLQYLAHIIEEIAEQFLSRRRGLVV
jgi:hypothetical protein